MRLTSSLMKRWGEWSVKYANLPDRYIKRAMEQIYYKPPRRINYLQKTVQRTKFRFSTNRPWTTDFYFENLPGTLSREATVEPIKDWSFFRGDKVQVLVGRDKGKQGVVKQIFQERNWVTVEGLNTRLKVIGKTKDFPGVVMLEEKPLLVTTEIKLIDPHDLEPTTVEWRYLENGERVRISIRTGRIIPVPIKNRETIDYKLPKLHRAGPKDTTKVEVEKITFEPALKTFEMEIMEKMGIEETRVPKKTYWY